MTTETTVTGTDYSVVIGAGLLKKVPRLIADRYPGAHAVLLTDNRVWDLYGASLTEGLGRCDIAMDDIIVPEGEASKSLDVYSGVIEELHHLGADNRSLLINLGGGVITDLGGFVASSYRQGLRSIYLPTTLHSQQEAVFGGRAAINTHRAKDFIGCTATPEAVYSDTATLQTLPQRDVMAGLAATLKLSLACNESLFALLEQSVDAILNQSDQTAFDNLVLASGRIRLAASGTEETRGFRELGLPFAHALESVCRYGGILHGEAIAWGIVTALSVAAGRELLKPAEVARIFGVLTRCGLPPEIPQPVLRAAIASLECRHTEFIVPVAVGRTASLPRLSRNEISDAVEFACSHPALGDPFAPGRLDAA